MPDRWQTTPCSWPPVDSATRQWSNACGSMAVAPLAGTVLIHDGLAYVAADERHFSDLGIEYYKYIA